MAKILVVDDEVSILHLASMFLQMMGYDVLTAGDGASVRALLNPLPDLILLDVWLGGEDGRTLCRWLKSREQTRHLPIFLLSASLCQPDTLQSCGADEFVPKPFRLQELAHLIASYLPPEAMGANQPLSAGKRIRGET